MLSLAALAAAECNEGPDGPMSPAQQGRAARYVPHTRTYYIAAEAVDWNFAPLDSDPVFSRRLKMSIWRRSSRSSRS